MAYTTPRTWVTGELVTAALMNTHIRDNLNAGFPNGTTQQTYVPALTASTTNPTLGSGSTAKGTYQQVADLVFFTAFIQFGSSGVNAGSGVYEVSLPVTAETTNQEDALGVYAGAVIGQGGLKDDSTGGNATFVSVQLATSTTVRMFVTASVQNNNPFTWAANDIITISGQYHAA